MKEDNTNNIQGTIISEYFKVSDKINFLSKEEQLELIKKAQNGDKEAEIQLIFSYFTKVYEIAKGYKSDKHSLKINDLVQSGLIGIVNAVKKFDPTRNVKFTTYAHTCVHSTIKRAINETGKTIRIPDHIVWDMVRISKAREFLKKQNLIEPTLEELSEHTKISVDNIKLYDEYIHEIIKFEDMLYEDEDSTFEISLAENENENIYSARNIIEQEEYKDIIYNNLKFISEKERQVLAYRYGLYGMRQHTLQEISNIIGLNINSVGNYERRAINKIRERNGLPQKKFPKGRRTK